MSIKEGTRTKRKKGKSIRRVIENPDVPLPTDCQSFLNDPNNKENLANFLSMKLISNAPPEKCVVTAAGLQEPTSVLSNRNDLDLDNVKCFHEEADTRIVIHCAHTDSRAVVV